MINSIYILLLGTAKKMTLTSMSIAIASVLFVVSTPSIPDPVSNAFYLLAGICIGTAFYYLGVWLSQYYTLEQESFESYKEKYEAFVKEAHQRKMDLASSLDLETLQKIKGGKDKNNFIEATL